MKRLTYLLPALALAACESSGSTDTGTDPGDTSDTSDTGDTNDTNDTGDTHDSNDTGDTHDTSDTGTPDPSNGYYGSPALAVIADNGSGAGKVLILEGGATALVEVEGLNVSSEARVGCAGPNLWILTPGPGGSGEIAYGIDVHNAAIASEITLPADFNAKVVSYIGNNYWFGGDGSASLVSYDRSGTAGATIDLSSLADADGKPEVRTVFQSPSGLGVVLARHDTGSGTYENSAVAIVDPMAASLTSSGSLASGNAGYTATGTPGGALIEILPHGADAGKLEGFDTTGLASTGTVIDYAGKTWVASVSGGNDGTVWVALKSGSTTTAHHYFADGTELGSFTTQTVSNALAPLSPQIYSGEGTGSSASIVPYDQGTGVAGTAITVGSSIHGLGSCIPAPHPPDTGDTAAPPE